MRAMEAIHPATKPTPPSLHNDGIRTLNRMLTKHELYLLSHITLIKWTAITAIATNAAIPKEYNTNNSSSN